MDGQPAPPAEPAPRWLRIAALAAAAALLAASLVSLGRYPIPHCDEVNHLALSYNFFREGRFVLHHMGGLGGFHRNFASQGRLYQVMKGAWLEVVGYTLAGGRFFSVLGCVVAAWLTYLAGRRLYGERAGLLAAVALLASPNVFYASHVGREETWVMAAGIGLIALYLAYRDRPSPARFALLGLLAALSLDIHPNAVWYALPLGLILVAENFRDAAGRIRILAFGAAGVLGAGIIVLAHLYPDPAGAMEHLTFASENNALWAGEIVTRIVEGARFFWANAVTDLNGAVAVLTVYVAFGAAWMLARRETADRLLLTLWGMSILFFTLLMGHKNPFYGVLWAPLAALAAGAGISGAASALNGRAGLRPAALAALVAAPLVAVGLTAQTWLAIRFRARDFPAYQAAILDVVPPGASVVGDVTLWTAFHDRNPFTADFYLETCRLDATCSARLAGGYDALIAGLDADYVVEDGSVGCAQQPTPAAEAWADALARTCTPVGRVADRWFGAYGQNGQGQDTVIYDCR
jgi:hypothetical protein